MMVEIDDVLYLEWSKALHRNNEKASDAINRFIEQYNIFGSFPFEEFHYSEKEPQPCAIDFTKSPLNKINPRKRSAVEAILMSDIPSSIERIIIFGSAITKHCKKTSDIDICIIGTYQLEHENDGTIPDGWMKKIRRKIGKRDIMIYTPEEYYDFCDFGVLKSIHRDGVTIYERKQSSSECSELV